MSELPLNEWIVLFYPQTGAVRLCPTLDFATRQLAGRSVTNLYRSPNDFRVKHDHNFLEKCWSVAYKRHADYTPKTATGILADHTEVPPDVGTEEFVKLLWAMLQDVGERMAVPESGGAKVESTATKENYEMLLGEMGKLIQDEDAFNEKYNKQARTVFEALYHNGKQFLDEDEIKKLIYTLVANRLLKTKQKPWVIFQYYRPEFIRDGYVIRGKRRNKKSRD